MSVNPWRGEVALTLNGERHVMRLTLGAIATLEAEADGVPMVTLVERFETGAFRALDILRLLQAGLSGAGTVWSLDDLARAEIDGGPIAAAQAAARLLRLSFALPDPDGAP